MTRPLGLALVLLGFAGSAAAEPIFRVPLGTSPMRGPSTAKVTIVGFLGFQCPFSGRATQTIRTLMAELPNDVRYVYKHRTLPFHQNAIPAARAALAAAGEGKFWDMHDRLFANQRALSRAELEQHALSMKLDFARFVGVLDLVGRTPIEDDEALAVRLGVHGTPTFFINGRKVSGAQPIEKFREIVKEEVARADRALAGGATLATLYETLTKDGLGKAPKEPARPYADRAAPPRFADIPLTTDDACRGQTDALVTLVVFIDFQCPFTARLRPTLDQLLSRYSGTLRICVKHNPLPFHTRGVPAANAAIEAHRLGNFWDYYDLLFANQRALEAVDLETYAQRLGLDVRAIADAVATEKHKAAIEAHKALAERVGARGTPTSFVNGYRLTGAQPLERFAEAIDEALRKAQLLVRAGVAPGRVYDLLRELYAPPKPAGSAPAP